MNDQVFQVAYTRVRERHSDQSWFALSPREITNAIYSEIRVIDRERFAPVRIDFVPMAIAAE